ncbi:hypothetical protein JOF56_009833 [Kibdelosporangium banguiense]|uniref:Uncharacterized protein n=1 Tax=Kibdelosporangium banguiense TaxID=1365924 RepID=A0ABS4TYH5_9PSEU|nr:hypothetical protein [Kibdelosporangium banguiense]MBP2329448.1 hypothetical protein [Kibdelosporangium banguiense]
MRTGVFLRWVAHPLTVGATAVLLLNDHVLKQAWPGVVTGKLSDVAGLVMAPPALGLLFGLLLAHRIGAAAAVLLTGVGFSLVKLTPAGAEVASAAWSVVNGPSVILADPSDLFALPALGLAWWAWCQVAVAPPLPDSLAFRLRVILAVPFTVLAITATSAPGDTLPSVDSVRGPGEGDVEKGAQVVIEVGWQVYGSRSGVDDWTLLSDAPSGPLSTRQRQIEACVPHDAGHCYRVHGGSGLNPRESPPHSGRLLGVDETIDAGQTWHTAWEVPAGRWPFVLRQHPTPGGVTRDDEVASVDILVRAVPGGHEVMVANGADGLAVRSIDGAWRRVPVVDAATGLDIRPAPLIAFGRAIGDDIIKAGLITLLALLIGMSVAAGRARARARIGFGLTAVLVSLGVLVLVAMLIIGMVGFLRATSRTSTGTWLAIALCLVGTGTVLTLTQRVLLRSRAAMVAAAAVLTGLAFVGPMLGWTVGYPQERGSAIGLGLIVAVVSLFVVVTVGWWAGRDPIQRLDPAVKGRPGARADTNEHSP